MQFSRLLSNLRYQGYAAGRRIAADLNRKMLIWNKLQILYIHMFHVQTFASEIKTAFLIQ